MQTDIVALLIPLSAVWGVIFLIALRIVRGGTTARKNTDPEETRLIQDIYHGLMKMEERVESLETLLVERERKGGTS
ncbi:MAG: hypothetical protein AMXMBFR84_32030 [Candidatus Hydrogenedentota bacterium]